MRVCRDSAREVVTLNAAAVAHAPAARRYRVFPATRPTSRDEVHHLATSLEQMLEQAGKSVGGAIAAWDAVFEELVRQVSGAPY